MSAPTITVTGANGLVGSHVCRALAERGATVRGIVRREGAAPALDGVEEWVGEFGDPAFAARVVEGVDGVVTTVHPMGSDLETERRVGVRETPVIARAAAEAGAGRLVHISTTSVYDRRPSVGDVDENSALVGDDAGVYPTTKKETDAALAEIDGITTILLRPPAILGAGRSSMWNTLLPAQVRDDASQRHANPMQTWAWVHVTDLAAIAADLATGTVADADDPEQGPTNGGCTVLNLVGGPATMRDYYGTVAEALGVEMTWDDGPAWAGQVLADRARRWGWVPQVDLRRALDEVAEGLR